MLEDKQIIIDGVDVSECRYLFDDTSYKRSKTSCSITLKDCKYLGNNCYYKQLKCKEQECEKIKNWVKGMMFYTDCSNWFERFTTAFEDWKNDLTTQLDQFKADNDELKKANKHIEHNRNQKADKLMRIEKLIIACSTGYTDEFIQELLVILHEPEPNSFENKYKQTLTEIKEIAVDNVYYLDCDYRWILENILQKISECEVEYDR